MFTSVKVHRANCSDRNWVVGIYLFFFYHFLETKQARAEIIFPVTRVRNFMKHGRYAKIIGTGSAVYLAAVLEYLAAEVMELAGNAARDNRRRRIIPRHIMMAVRCDSELSEVFKNVTIAEGGVLPFIHDILMPKRSKQGPSQRSGSSNE